MRLWKTIVFGVILAGLIAYIYKVELPADEAKKRAESVFPEITGEKLHQLAIKNGESTVALNNKRPSGKGATESESFSDDGAASWEIEGLPNSKVDSATLTPILRNVTDLKYGTKIPSEDVEKLEVYGLGNPALTLKVKTEDIEKTVSFGKKNEYTQKQYMTVSGTEGVYLSEPFLADSIGNKKRDDFRSKTPFSFPEADLKTITFRSERGETKFEKTDDHKFKMVSPGAYKTETQAVNDTMRDLRNFTVSEFIDPSSPEKALDRDGYGLDKPAFAVTLDYKNEIKREFRFGKSPKGEIYGEVEGVASFFKLPGDSLQKVDKPVESFRLQKHLAFALTSVEKVVFEKSGGQPLLIEKAGQDWKVDGKPGDTPFVESLLRDVADLKAHAFPRAARDFGLESPRLKVTVHQKLPKGETIGEFTQKESTLKVGGIAAPEEASVDGKKVSAYYAEVDEIGETFILSEESLKKITPKVESLVKADPSPTASPSIPPAKQ